MRMGSRETLHLLTIVLSGWMATTLHGLTLKPADSGITIDAGTLGNYTLEYPTLLDGGQKNVHKLIQKSASGNAATLKYEGGTGAGTQIAVQVKEDGTISFTPSNLPDDVKTFGTRMLINPAPVAGGTFSFGGKAAQPFPEQKPAKPHLYQGNVGTFTIKSADGKLLTFQSPFPYTYNQLTDSREWNWNVFHWTTNTPFNPDVKTYTLRVYEGDPTTAPPPAPAAKAASATPGQAPRPAAPASAAKSSVTATDKGIHIDGGLLRFTLEYPQLQGADQKVIHKLIEKQVSANSATLKYEGGTGAGTGAGGQIDLKINNGEVGMDFRNMPDDFPNYACLMLIDYGISNGGTWKVDDQAEQPFPTEKPAKPHLYQGHARKITFKGYDGRAVTLACPENAYFQLTDNREWGWKIFAFRFNAPFNKDNPAAQLKVSFGAGDTAAAIAPQVDKFGQPTKKDYPGKVTSIDELKADVEADKAYYASFNPPKLDTYGGLPGSGEKLGLQKTGFFHVQKKGERWYLVDPEGNAFFHLAIGCFTPASATYVSGREQIYEWLPPHDGEFAGAWLKQDRNSVDFHVVNEIRKYGQAASGAEDHTAWLDRMIYRVRQFGFNSGGPFTGGMEKQPAGAHFPYVAGLPLNEWDAGIKRIPGIRETWDPFDPKIVASIEKNFQRIAASANDPLIIGRFIINEPLYEDIPKVVPTLNGKYACKCELVDNLKAKYATIADFNQAWKMQATTFEELVDKGLPVTTRAANADMQAYTAHFLDVMMNTVCTTARKYDPNHMIIGNRLQSGTINNEQLCRIFSKYLDVMSFNYYTYYLDKDFLQRIYGWTGRPMFLSEFYWNSPSDSGLPGGVKDIGSQQERGLAYRNYVEQAASPSLGFVCGIEWFTLVDQSVTGNWFSKYSGENGNTGFFSVADRPYKPMIAEMVKTNYGIYDVMSGQRPAYVFDDPRFNQKSAGQKTLKITRATGPITIDGGTKNWPGIPAETISGKRLVEGTTAGTGADGVEGSFKLCWDEKNLYVLANIVDPTPMQNSNPVDDIWRGDAVELFIGGENIDQGGALLFTDRQILLRGATSPDLPPLFVNRVTPQPTFPTVVIANVDGKGYTIEAAIPFSLLNITPAEGKAFRFDLSIDDSADGKRRLRQLAWNGTNRNSGDRTNWGMAVLSQ